MTTGISFGAAKQAKAADHSPRTAAARSHLAWRLLVILAALGGGSIPAAPPQQQIADDPNVAATADATLIVRGSVEQIHVIHADAGTEVVVEGPDGFRKTATTDDRGGLILRKIPPGDGYRVVIGGDERGAHTLRVLDRHQHPNRDFYESQVLEPTAGYIETRDGTLLSYRVELPDAEVHGPGPYGLVITYSGYQPGLKTENGYQNIPFEKFTEAGYAVAGVNMRGSGCSGGAFDLMEPVTWLDGYDMIEAFAAQPWVDGVALGDQSWPGLTQLYVASTQPPSLVAIMAGSVVGDFYRDVFYPGGIQNIGFGHIWAAGRDIENAFPTPRKEVNAKIAVDPVCAANQALRGQNVVLRDTIRNQPFDGEHWQGRSAELLVGKIQVPVLQVVSWQDPQVGSRPATLYERYAADTPIRLVGVNGFHQYWSGDVWQEVHTFLDIYLGDATTAEVDAYEAQNRFVVLLESNSTGDVRGRMTLPGYTIDGEGRRMILGSDLIADDADEDSRSSTWNYDPSSPGSWTKPAQDCVTFTSAVLSQNEVMAGSSSADLWIAAEAKDVDLQVTLSEVRPDGQEMLVQSGWLRASHRALDEKESMPLRPRHLHTQASLADLVPGEVTPVRIELFPFAHVFRKGSRIRLTISGPGGGSNGWPWAFESVKGQFPVRIVHDGQTHSSSIVLPVVRPTDLELPDSLPEPDSVWLQPCRPVK